MHWKAGSRADCAWRGWLAYRTVQSVKEPFRASYRSFFIFDRNHFTHIPFSYEIVRNLHIRNPLPPPPPLFAFCVFASRPLIPNTSILQIPPFPSLPIPPSSKQFPASESPITPFPGSAHLSFPNMPTSTFSHREHAYLFHLFKSPSSPEMLLLSFVERGVFILWWVWVDRYRGRFTTVWLWNLCNYLVVGVLQIIYTRRLTTPSTRTAQLPPT